MILNSKAIQSNFISSATSIANSFEATNKEVVFIGRSNVGKSSTLNSIAQRKHFAKISSTPGKTKLINFFYVVFRHNIGETPIVLIDVPGFGYSKVSKAIKEMWNKEILNFLQNRVSIKLIVHLIDSRHTDLPIDKVARKTIQSLINCQYITIYTKSDKLTKSQLCKSKSKYKDSIFISSLKNTNIDKLRDKILHMII